MAKVSQIYTYDEVFGHRDYKDCWLIINGKVYDVSPFMNEHPGGDEVMIAATGKDATEDFDDIGHSISAIQMLDKYYIGEIDPSSVPTKKRGHIQEQESINPKKSSGFVMKVLQFLVPLFILGLALTVREFTKKGE